MPVEFTHKGFDELKEKLDPKKFQKSLRKNVRKAMKKCALFGEGEIIKDIHGGEYEPNSPVTAAIKGSNRPLVDSGELVKQINSEVPRWDTAVMGIIRDKVVSRWKK